MAEEAPRPLAGHTIMVTRSREQASELSRRLQALGAEIIEIPTIAIVPPASYAPLDLALAQLHTFDWLIVTSANTARVLGERGSFPTLVQPRTIAVGPATAAALHKVGLRVDLVPEPAVAESVVAALRDHAAGHRVLLARAETARDVLPVSLEQAGAQVTVVDAYRTVLAEDSITLVAATFTAPQCERIDALTFTSSSTVRNLAALLERAGAAWPMRAKVFSIGPITSGTLREYGLEPDREAAQHDVEGLVRVMVEELGGRRTSALGLGVAEAPM